MMRSGRKLLVALVSAGVVALVASACGGGDPTATAPPRQPTPTTAPAATATRPPQATPALPGQPTATATRAPAVQPTATAVPAGTPRPAATPVPQATPTPVPPQAGVPNLPQAKRGGVLRRRLDADAGNWDALVSRSFNSQDPLQLAHDQLVQSNPYNQSEVVPNLAESWSVSADGLTWTFKMRQGVKFHNGNPLTSADVKFSFDSILNPYDKVPNPQAANLAGVQSMTAPDASTFVMKLDAPSAAFLPAISSGRMMIVSKAHVDKEGWPRHEQWPPNGTGPFMGTRGSAVRGVSVEVVRNDNYYMPGRPFLDGMKYFIMPDVGTTFAAFLTGQINFGLGLNLGQSKEAKDRLKDRLHTQQTASTAWWSVEINGGRKPYDDVRVRQAIAYAVDKQAVVDAAVQGLGVLSGYVVPEVGFGLTAEELKLLAGYVNDRKANLAKAKQLLTEAGFPNGFETAYFVRNTQVYVDHSTLVKAMLEDVGIKGKLELVDQAQFFGELLDVKKWQISVQGHRTPTTDPNAAYQTFHLCGAPRNFTGVCDKKITELYDAQAREIDPKKRQEKVKALEKYTLALYGNPMLYHGVTIYARYANVKNHEYHVAYNSNLQMRDVWIE